MQDNNTNNADALSYLARNKPLGLFRFQDENEEHPSESEGVAENPEKELTGEIASGANQYLNYFVPLMLSMTLNRPLEYWELTYAQQYESLSSEFQDSPSLQQILDSLFVWFGNQSILLSVETVKKLPDIDVNSSILDLGTGNGHFLQVLKSLGYNSLFGSDFSPAAITLCKEIDKLCKRNEPESNNSSLSRDIEFVVDDVLESHFTDGQFDIIYDKGTFDSIAMVSKVFVPEEMKNTSSNDQKPFPDAYVHSINRLLKPGKFFVLLSCNHDQEELQEIFVEQAGFVLVKDLTDYLDDLRMMIYQKKKE